MAHDEEQYEELPESLVEGFRAADRAVPMITVRVDRRVSEMAKAHFSARRARRRMPRTAWAAIAASVLVAVVAGYWRPDPAPDEADIYADIDGSGRIDIADVLALARTQDRGERSQAQLDRFASSVVSLKRRGEAS